MKAIGIALWILGVLLFIGGLGTKTSVSGGSFGGDINNIGLLQQQMIIVNAGIGLFVAGAIVHALANALDVLTRGGHKEQDIESSSLGATEPDKTCQTGPWEGATAEERYLWDAIERFGITRTDVGGYRQGELVYETLEQAVDAGRRHASGKRGWW